MRPSAVQKSAPKSTEQCSMVAQTETQPSATQKDAKQPAEVVQHVSASPSGQGLGKLAIRRFARVVAPYVDVRR